MVYKSRETGNLLLSLPSSGGCDRNRCITAENPADFKMKDICRRLEELNIANREYDNRIMNFHYNRLQERRYL